MTARNSQPSLADLTYQVMLINAWNRAGVAFRSVTLDAKSVGLPDSMNGTARLVATQEQGEASLATGFALAGDNLDLSDVQLVAPATKVTGSAAVNLASLLTSGRIGALPRANPLPLFAGVETDDPHARPIIHFYDPLGAQFEAASFASSKSS